MKKKKGVTALLSVRRKKIKFVENKKEKGIRSLSFIKDLGWPFCVTYLIGSLSNHGEDGNKKPHKFAYLTMKNSIFARFARAFFIF